MADQKQSEFNSIVNLLCLRIFDMSTLSKKKKLHMLL